MENSRFEFRAGGKTCIFFKTSMPSLRTIQPSTQWETLSIPRGGKFARACTVPLTPSSAELENKRSYTSAPTVCHVSEFADKFRIFEEIEAVW
jgi:hypothetical protein